MPRETTFEPLSGKEGEGGYFIFIPGRSRITIDPASLQCRDGVCPVFTDLADIASGGIGKFDDTSKRTPGVCTRWGYARGLPESTGATG